MIGALRLGAAAAVPRRPAARLLAYLAKPTWDARYLQLKAYREAAGDCRVPYHFAAADGTKLGWWVNTQRLAHKAGKLAPERVERLKSVAFVWDAQADKWDAYFELLQAYRAAHGDCAVPSNFAAADGTMLGCWVNRQRHAHKSGELNPERTKRLEAVAFVWDAQADGWDACFELLTAYRAAHGDSAVPYHFATTDGNKLGLWVNTQRDAYKAGKLSPERVERLKAVAFVWDSQADGWDAYFELLTAYRAAHGDCAVPYRFAVADGAMLGAWVIRQRFAYKAGELHPERAKRLEAVAFVLGAYARRDAIIEVLHPRGDCAARFAGADGTKLGGGSTDSVRRGRIRGACRRRAPYRHARRRSPTGT
ncbi:helicase associated domain-containing protein [Pelagophyceae sp. CCMP2097]|nr:helicase associated domain-containing protein [Pelagophyceae sp. CCMP2097]